MPKNSSKRPDPRDEVAEIADALIERLYDLKDKVTALSPEKKKKAAKVLAGAGAVLVGLGLIRKAKKRRAAKRKEV